MCETLPIHSSHPFWSCTTGSRLKISTFDNSRSLLVTVNSISKPYVYKLEFNSDITYHNKKQIIKIIKNDWWKHFGSKTLVEIEKHNNVDISLFSDRLPVGSSGSSTDSCSSSPSSESLQKTSLISSSYSPTSTENSRSINSESRNSHRRKNSTGGEESKTLNLLKKVSDKLLGK